jgi:uncharacterized membrane protein YfcA
MKIFSIYLPVVGIQFNFLFLILIGFCVGVIAGFFGEGGGWFVTPALNIFGIPIAYAIGTCLANIFGQSLGALKKHHKMGNIDWKLGFITVIVSIIGFESGSQVVMALEISGDAGIIIRWCYVVFLAGLGSFMFYDYFVLQKRAILDEDELNKPKRNKVAEKLYNVRIPPMISFPASQIKSVSIWVIIVIFLLTGFFSGLLGIGGGFIILPTLIYLIGLPTVMAVGTTLITVFFSSSYGCFIYAVNGRVEIVAAFILLIGASVGAQIGATAIKYIKGYGIRLIFAIMILFAGLAVITEQLFKITGKPYFQTIAEIVLLGTAMIITTIIIGKLIVESRKEKLISNNKV